MLYDDVMFAMFTIQPKLLHTLKIQDSIQNFGFVAHSRNKLRRGWQTSLIAQEML